MFGDFALITQTIPIIEEDLLEKQGRIYSSIDSYKWT